jgi:Flp pilus assembly protein TadB
MSDNVAEQKSTAKKSSSSEKQMWTSKKETEDKEPKIVVKRKPNHVWTFGTLTLGIASLVLVTLALWYELGLSLPIATAVGVVIFAMFVYYEYHRNEKKNRSVPTEV